MAKDSSHQEIDTTGPLLSESSDRWSGDGKYRSFIENLPVMFYAVEPTAPHTPIYISPTFERFGYPLEDWHTQSDIWDRVIYADDRDEVLRNTRSAMANGHDVDSEYRVVC